MVLAVTSPLVFLINHNYRLNALPHKNLEVMPSFDPLQNPPNWNGSATGVAGYWEWMHSEPRVVNGKPTGEYGTWRWFDNPQQPEAQVKTKQKKSKNTISMSVSDAWIVGTALLFAGVTIGLVLVILIKN